MGYPATNGVVNVNAGLVPIALPVGVTQAAQATQNISITANLNAGATVGTAFTTPVKIYDSLGKSHALTVTYTKTAQNQWDYSVSMPAGEATGAPTNNTGTLTFDSNGNLTAPTGTISNITFPATCRRGERSEASTGTLPVAGVRRLRRPLRLPPQAPLRRTDTPAATMRALRSIRTVW